jgi:hypothetical protein
MDDPPNHDIACKLFSDIPDSNDVQGMKPAAGPRIAFAVHALGAPNEDDPLKRLNWTTPCCGGEQIMGDPGANCHEEFFEDSTDGIWICNCANQNVYKNKNFALSFNLLQAINKANMHMTKIGKAWEHFVLVTLFGKYGVLCGYASVLWRTIKERYFTDIENDVAARHGLGRFADGFEAHPDIRPFDELQIKMYKQYTAQDAREKERSNKLKEKSEIVHSKLLTYTEGLCPVIARDDHPKITKAVEASTNRAIEKAALKKKGGASAGVGYVRSPLAKNEIIDIDGVDEEKDGKGAALDMDLTAGSVVKKEQSPRAGIKKASPAGRRDFHDESSHLLNSFIDSPETKKSKIKIAEQTFEAALLTAQAAVESARAQTKQTELLTALLLQRSGQQGGEPKL